MATKSKKKRGSRRGKKKLNTRLLAIVGLIIVMVGGVGAGLLYLKVKGSVGRNLAAGRAFLEEDKHEKALRAIGKVLNRETGNQMAHNLRRVIYEDMIPETPERAASLYRDYVVALAQHSQFTEANEEISLRSLEECWLAAMSTDRDGYWSLLKSQAEEQRKRFSSGTPVYNRATLLLGLAQMRLGQSNFLGDVDSTGHVRFPGEAELTEFVELEPDSDDGLARLAFGRMAVARRLGLEGRVQQELQNLAMAQETYDEAIAQNPDGIETLLAVVRHLYVHELVSELRGSMDSDSLTSKLDELNRQLDVTEDRIASREDAQRHQILELARYLALIDLESGHSRASEIFKWWLARNPNDLNVKVLMASELMELEEYGKAEELLSEVLATPTLPVSIASQRQQSDRLVAAVTQFEINERRRKAGGSAEISARAYEYRDKVQELIGGASDHPVVLMLNGRIAHAEGRHATAVKAFERSLSLGGTLAGEPLLQSAHSLEQIGQAGLAVQRLEQAIREDSRSIRNRLLLAQLHARMRDPKSALDVLATIPDRVRSQNPDIARLEETLRLSALSPADRVVGAASIDDEVLQAIAKADQLDADGQIVEAGDLLKGILKQHPEDIRLLVAISQVESRLGNTESAASFLNDAVALQPNNDRLRQMALGLASADLVELVMIGIKDQYPEGDARDIAMYVNLEMVADRNQSQGESLAESDPERSAELLEIAKRAHEAAAPFEKITLDSTHTSSEAFAFHFERHLREGDFAAAEALLPAARDGDFDSAGGNLAEARLLLRQGVAAPPESADRKELLTRAAAAARRATDVSPWRNMTWETLAQSMVVLGEFEEARLAYEELLQRNPSDVRGITRLASLNLQDGGDPGRAVAILADASKRLPADGALRESWLQLEAAHGSPVVALRERLLDWNRNPTDRNAALWYAGMLAALPAEYSYDLGSDGQPRISGRRWLGMSAKQQSRVLKDLKESWLVQISKIAERLASEPDSNMQEAIQHATILREIGDRDEMMEVLRRYLDTQQDSDDIISQAIQAGRFLLNSDRFWEARNLLEGYRDLQSLERLEVDGVLADLLHRGGLCEEALPYLANVGQVTGKIAFRMREVDCLLQLHRLDEAEDAIQTLLKEHSNEYQLALLEAGLHSSRGSVAEAAGDTKKALESRDAFRAALERASSLDATRVAPYVDLVESLVLEYRRTLDRTKLEEAMRYLDAAADIGDGSEQLAIQRAEVNEALGDPRRAVLDLEQFLRRHPDSRKVRGRLASAYVTAGTPTRSIDTLEQAIAMEPRDPYWHGLLGDHHRQSGLDLAAASRGYIEAWKLEPTRRRLTALVDATVTTAPWDYEAFLEAAKEHPDRLREDPRATGLLARAEHGVGLESRSRETLREAYRQYTQAINGRLMPATFLRNWYQDLYVLFPDDDIGIATAMVDSVTGGEPTLWDRRGLARYYQLRGGEHLSAAIELQQAVVAESDTDHIEADIRVLGSLQLQAGLNSDAEATFRKLVEMNPNDAIALNNYAFLLATAGNDPASAEPYALRAVDIAPREGVILDTMTTIQHALGKNEAALSSCLARLAIDPNNTELLQKIASILAEDLGRPQDAVAYANQALSLDPRGALSLDSTGWVAWQAGDQSKGRDLVGQSLRRQPTALAHLHMAQILQSSGDRGAAREHLQQAEHLATEDSVKAKIRVVRADLDGEG
ncbi:MAG: tetratricopeptide repeat protein [Planctomycetes bacterium]|nr:tetratricopeptide repeat protein [Planctomycetota bacterium]MCP4840036.1 tetratricopeptide repeat protein [Planctomycetota bacterium]